MGNPCPCSSSCSRDLAFSGRRFQPGDICLFCGHVPAHELPGFVKALIEVDCGNYGLKRRGQHRILLPAGRLLYTLADFQHLAQAPAYGPLQPGPFP